jgi:hypothetical protein
MRNKIEKEETNLVYMILLGLVYNAVEQNKFFSQRFIIQQYVTITWSNHIVQFRWKSLKSLKKSSSSGLKCKRNKDQLSQYIYNMKTFKNFPLSSQWNSFGKNLR